VAVAELTLRSLERADHPRWDRFVEDCPGATFFHTAGWQEVLETGLGLRTHYLYAVRGERIVGVLPLAQVKSRLFGNRLTSTAFCDQGGPATVEPEAERRLVAAASEIAADNDVDFLELRCPPPPGETAWRVRDNLYAAFRRRLLPEPEANFMALHRKRRAVIRQAKASGLESEPDADVAWLHHIFAVSVRNLGTPVLPKVYFEVLKRVYGERCRILNVVKDGEAVASVMSFYFRNEVLAYHGGGLPVARELGANDFMYWEVMRRAVEAGVEWFDFGRSKTGTGAYAFKKNWGFEPQALSYAYQLRKIRELPDINPLNPKYRLFIALWRHLPLPLSKMLGPHLVRQLG
jgi:FemAB-related protein (PEP-CTERM system-associated)